MSWVFSWWLLALSKSDFAFVFAFLRRAVAFLETAALAREKAPSLLSMSAFASAASVSRTFAARLREQLEHARRGVAKINRLKRRAFGIRNRLDRKKFLVRAHDDSQHPSALEAIDESRELSKRKKGDGSKGRKKKRRKKA